MSSNYTYSYHPIPEVKSGHGIPHVTTSGTWLKDPVFGQPDFRTCCFRCSKTYAPNESDIAKKPYNNDREKWAKDVIKRRRIVSTFFVAFVSFGIISAHMMWIGGAKVKNGISEANSSIGALKNIFTNVKSAAIQIQVDASLMQINIASSNCNPSIQSAMFAAVSALSSASSSLQSVLDPIPPQLDKGQGYLSRANAVTDEVVGAFFAVIVLFGIMYLLSAFVLKSKIAVQLCMVVTELIVIALTVICAIEMIFVTFFGDFCMDPTSLLLSLLPQGFAHDTAEYYTKCVSTNPFASSVDDALVQAQSFSSLITQNCPGDASLQNALTTLTGVFEQIGLIDKQILECAPLAKVWNGIINKSICTHFYGGLYTIWITQYVVSGMLFFCMCFASIIYYFFPSNFWSLTAVGVDSSSSAATNFDGASQALSPNTDTQFVEFCSNSNSNSNSNSDNKDVAIAMAVRVHPEPPF